MSNYKILIVDDTIGNLKLMVSIFEKYEPEYKVYQTNNPQMALSISIKVQPDLIITDWNMPSISGIELIKILKKESILKDTPIIMATGVMLSSEDLQTALTAGATDYIRKPLDPVELIARCKSALLISSYYTMLVEQKNKDLAESSLHLIKAQRFNRTFVSEIERLKEIVVSQPGKAVEKLEYIKSELLQEVEEEGWYRFNISFSQVHANFHKKITEEHPNITPAELKLCTFVKMGMANKEIASVLNQTADSIKTSRYRLRKKLNLEGVNLETYLTRF